MTRIDVTPDALSETDHQSQLRRTVFLLDSTVTGLVFGKLSLPKSDPLVGVLDAFAAYTLGFGAMISSGNLCSRIASNVRFQEIGKRRCAQEPNQSLFLLDGRKRTRAPGISPGRDGGPRHPAG
jgi:hypothetical protein